jgi:hypothetical protein
MKEVAFLLQSIGEPYRYVCIGGCSILSGKRLDCFANSGRGIFEIGLSHIPADNQTKGQDS